MDHIMNVNKEWFLDRVKACWMGKNIGGTMGVLRPVRSGE